MPRPPEESPSSNRSGPDSREERAFAYLRQKVDDLLRVIGTSPLRPEELDDESLLTLDPIGIITDSFSQILEHLRETNARLVLARDELQAIFESAGAGIMLVDTDRRIVSCNSRLQTLFGVSGETVAGRRCNEVFCRGSQPPPDCVCAQVLAANDSRRTDTELAGRDFEVVGTPLHGGDGAISHVVLVYHDISERRRAERGLQQALAEARQARNRLDAILRSVADALVVTDAGGRVILMNPQAETLLGACLCDSTGMPLEELVPVPEFAAQLAAFQAQGDAGSHFDLALPDPEGASDSIYQARISPIRAGGGTPGGMVVIMHDVTRERAVERLKSEFVATAAHELRTPLATVVGYTELLLHRKRLGAEERREYLRQIYDKGLVLSRILDELLDINRMEAGYGLPVQFCSCPLAPLLAEPVDFQRRRSRRHRFVVDLPDRPLLVQADPNLVGQALANLLDNAVKFSPAGGEIWIRAWREAPHCRLEIRDPGIGMTQEQAERAFDKFYRADASDTAGQGRGLGLTLTRNIILAHEGTIAIDSTPGEGTAVHLSLPLAPGS